jgi:NAD(P)-dependent dehydrogenase (short-subunit alcohol dehydrogenase family)
MSAKPISECGVVVLGGTAGVGLETAVQFAAQGARVIVLGRDAARGAQACKTVSGIDFLPVDASDPAAAVDASVMLRERLGAIDVLVCTTGPSHPPTLLRDIPIDQIRTRIDEIILPPLHMMHAVLTIMREQRSGAIVTVASDAAKLATPGETLIGAAMAALVMFAKAAAVEHKREGIRINLLTPSLIAGTPGAALIGSDLFAAKMFEKAAGLAHLGVPDATDLASVAVFLASPAARRITGQAISINGGISVA